MLEYNPDDYMTLLLIYIKDDRIWIYCVAKDTIMRLVKYHGESAFKTFVKTNNRNLLSDFISNSIFEILIDNVNLDNRIGAIDRRIKLLEMM